MSSASFPRKPHGGHGQATCVEQSEAFGKQLQEQEEIHMKENCLGVTTLINK